MKRRFFASLLTVALAAGLGSFADAKAGCALDITSPEAGDVRGALVEVDWSHSSACDGEVSLQAKRGDGKYQTVVNAVDVDAGSLLWNAGALESGTDYFLRLKLNGTKTKSPKAGPITIDTVAPEISFVGRTPANEAGWNGSAVDLEWACSDSMTGVSKSTILEEVGSEGAGQTATATCFDVAGNSSSDSQSEINIDLTAPILRPVRNPAPNAFGWNNTDVFLFWSCRDELSGIRPRAIALRPFSNEGAGQGSSSSCTDRAGNTAEASINDINIDKTPPATSIDVPLLPVIARSTGATTLSGHSSDALSGLTMTTVTFTSAQGEVFSIPVTFDGAPAQVGWEVSLDGMAAGLYWVSAASEDRAGNAGPATAPILLIVE